MTENKPANPLEMIAYVLSQQIEIWNRPLMKVIMLHQVRMPV